MSAPYLLALDLATTTGICEGRPGEIPKFSTKKFSGEDRLAVAASAMRWIALRLKSDPPDAMYVEEPMRIGAAIHGKSNAAAIIRLNTLYDVIGGAAKLRGVRVAGVPVNDARMAFLGEGRLERDEAKARCMALCGLLGWPANNRDEADAAAIWYWASCVEVPKIAAVVHPGLQRKAASIVAGEAIAGGLV